MKRGVLKAVILVVVTGVLLLGLTTTVSANGGGDGCPCDCGSQKWYLDSRDNSPVPGTRLMYKTASSIETGTVTVEKSECTVWCADEPAGGDVTFPYGIWTMVIRTDSDWGLLASDCDADVGYVDEAGAFTSFDIPSTFRCYFYGAEKIIEWQMQMGSKTVPGGKYLAVRICNADDVDHDVVASGDLCRGSMLKSPCSDPGYPAPELPAGILLGVGLVGVGGFAYVASRRREATS